MNDIIVALVSASISGTFAVIGVIITNIVSSKNTTKVVENKIITAQAVTDTKIEELTREVREHNNFARRMPVVEEQIKVINHRVSDLEEINKKIS